MPLHRKQQRAIQKELDLLMRRERKFREAARRERDPGIKEKLAAKVPDRVYSSLVDAFCTGFFAVFDKGGEIIGKSFSPHKIQQNYQILDYAVQVKGGRGELRRLRQSAGAAGLRNTAITTAEGIGLGLLGIGIPDIVLFLGMLLKGIYETALHYGFSYHTQAERFFILYMAEASMRHGAERDRMNAQIDRWLYSGLPQHIDSQMFKEQIRHTAEAFAADMLAFKFLQGIPIAGILGGASNPVYYRRVMKYVQLKYEKRYLLGLLDAGT